MKRAIIVAGGTGGHLYPGICLARELQDRGYDTAFIVRRNDRGISVLQKEQIKYSQIRMVGLPRKLSYRLAEFIYCVIAGFFDALAVIRQQNPDVIIGMGGYVSFPVIGAARVLGVPTLIHEQNALPGLANRVLGRIAGRIAVSFEGSEKYFNKSKTVVTGNPVRRSLTKGMERTMLIKKFNLKERMFTVLIFGGSQGAHSINTALINSLQSLEGFKDKIQFLHIVGGDDFADVKDGYETHGFSYAVFEYMYEMAEAYVLADLVICRAGATTIAELMMLRKPALLIPFPYATGRHQDYNARYLTDLGAAVFAEEKGLNEILPGILKDFTLHPDRIQAMRDSYRNTPARDSAKLVIDEAEAIVRKGA